MPWTLPRGTRQYLKEILGRGCVLVAHLYTKDNEPVVDFPIRDYNINNSYKLPTLKTEKLLEWVVKSFGNNIKEVYFVFSDMGLEFEEVISRVNLDGEYTLTIY